MTILIGNRSADTELGTVVTVSQSEAELGLSDKSEAGTIIPWSLTSRGGG